jgi:predicted nucleic acid-binding protein
MSRVYLDACAIIYLIEAGSPFHEIVVRRILIEQENPSAVLLTSRLSRLKCWVRPLKLKDRNTLALYDKFFEASRLELIELTPEVIEHSTRLRAAHGFSSPDAIHWASAVAADADLFLTGDAALARCPEVRVEVLTI